jgi:hypothetical protein
MLQDKRLLTREKVGLRHIIKTDGTVQYVGYDIGFTWDNRELPNFYPGVQQTDCVVQYNNQRADLSATIGRMGWEGHVLDVGTHFPPNPLATKLLNPVQASAVVASRPLPIVYGDAVLVTDNRMHWVFRPYHVSIEDVEAFNDTLLTPRDLIIGTYRATIFFHTEPNQNDLMAFMMRWV